MAGPTYHNGGDQSISDTTEEVIGTSRSFPLTKIATDGLGLDSLLALDKENQESLHYESTPAYEVLRKNQSSESLESIITTILQSYIRDHFAKAAQSTRVNELGRAASEAPVRSWDEDEPIWKRDPSVSSVLGWCVHAMAQMASPLIWERVWPLVIPPVMMMLEAPGAYPKLLGVCVACHMLDTTAMSPVPVDLLRRTGLTGVLNDALRNAMHHFSDAHYGAMLLSGTLKAKNFLAVQLYPRTGASAEAFESHMQLFTKGCLEALAYCAPASVSALALRAPPGPALGSARLQQSLAGTSSVWIRILCDQLGPPLLQYWNAYVDWAIAWISEAFSACTSLESAPYRSMTTVVDQITGVDDETHDSNGADTHMSQNWTEAAEALLSCVSLSVRGVDSYINLVKASNTQDTHSHHIGIPQQFPNLSRWTNKLVCACARCYIHLTEISKNSHPKWQHAITTILQDLSTLCASLQAIDSDLEKDMPTDGVNLGQRAGTNRRGHGRGRGNGRGRGGRGSGARGGAVNANREPGSSHDITSSVKQEATATEAAPAPSSSNQSEKAVENAPIEADEDAEICFICAEPVTLFSVPPCNHRVCHICSMRLRALWKKRDCTFCKAEATNVIFTPNADRNFGDFSPAELPYRDDKLSISFEREKDYHDTIAMLRFNCPVGRCEVMSSGWSDLKSHVKREHSRLLCDLCIKHKKIFSHEHSIYTAASLQEHLTSDHRYCEYCRQHFYSDDELWVHMRDRHEQCHICKSRSEEERWRYYKDYRMLEQHFRDAHYLCPDAQCLAQKFVVFENQMEFQVHQVQEHGKTLSSREKRDALRMDASFIQQEPVAESSHNTSRRGKKPREPVSIQAQNQPATSSRRAQFGHSLTEQPSQGSEQQQSEKYWSTVLTVLNDSQIKLTACRSALQAYRVSELNVHDLLKTVMNVTGDGTDHYDYGSTDLIIQSLAEIVQNGEKSKELVQEWNKIKARENRFPTPLESHGGAVRQLKNASSGNNRVWENVARAASNKPKVQSHAQFPRLNASRVPGSAAYSAQSQRHTQSANTASWNTAQVSGPKPQPRPTPFSVSVSTPRSSGGASRNMMAANQFPGLPSNQSAAQRQAEKRSLFGRAPTTPNHSWGAMQGSRPAMDTDAFPSLSQVSESLPQTSVSNQATSSAQTTGRQRRKKGVLLSSVSSMHHG
ncbi:RING-type E3 ubiquitin transferase [Malassezia yamatoensis]|uniref:RING-type E3 ubiquitin transferase n=1 Tax=Malassezia yamatoensis TaxID=253288 RepID=A0AAJ6CHG0_9BASI|nr:RING-type E3 ubiquitin transferase [Malassezia yamatoensis]